MSVQQRQPSIEKNDLPDSDAVITLESSSYSYIREQNGSDITNTEFDPDVNESVVIF